MYTVCHTVNITFNYGDEDEDDQVSSDDLSEYI